MIKASKILFINIFLFSIFFLIIELIFGYWFDKDNLGPYLREHRMKKVSYSINYESKKNTTLSIREIIMVLEERK